jgi:hypothetical protein
MVDHVIVNEGRVVRPSQLIPGVRRARGVEERATERHTVPLRTTSPAAGKQNRLGRVDEC